MGRTKASKLLARKRPALIPIWDSVIGGVTQAGDSFWEPLRQELRADDAALHRRLLRLRDRAGLSPTVTALRVFDVVCWMEGKDRGYKTIDEDAPAEPAVKRGAAPGGGLLRTVGQGQQGPAGTGAPV